MTDPNKLKALSERATQGEWVNYPDERPPEGFCEWRLPSVAVPGLTVTLIAKMRERGAGYQTVLSPVFDYWDGYNVHVPNGLQWRPISEQPAIQQHETIGPFPEGVTLVPCPFCGNTPKWRSSESDGRGTTICAAPQRHNSWWLAPCCKWCASPRYRDPRKLASARTGLLSGALVAALNKGEG